MEKAVRLVAERNRMDIVVLRRNILIFSYVSSEWSECAANRCTVTCNRLESEENLLQWKNGSKMVIRVKANPSLTVERKSAAAVASCVAINIENQIEKICNYLYISDIHTYTALALRRLCTSKKNH